MAFARVIVWGVLALSVGCSSTDDADDSAVTLDACSPLEATTSTVTLDTSSILAAGRSADGTTYVIATPDSKLRLFVSAGNGKQLFERPEVGTGEEHETASTTWLFDYSDADGTPVSVEVVQDAAGLNMGVLRGAKPEGAKTWALEQGELLTALPASEAAALPASSEQTFFIDYAGLQSDGSEIVVIAPEHAGSYDDFRLFFGPASDLQERAITSFTRSRSSTTSLTFDTGSGSAMLTYSYPEPPFDTDSVSEGSIVFRDGKVYTLLGSAPPTLPDGAHFSCR